MLHYVGVLSVGEAQHLQSALSENAATKDTGHLRALLAAQCFGLLPGFHRILLEGSQLSLTLCVGEVHDILAKQEMQADCLLAKSTDPGWDKWRLKALARCCKRGTDAFFSGPSLPPADLLMDAGFALQPSHWGALSGGQSARHALYAHYLPRWELRAKRHTSEARLTAARCAVIGAGIAGASVARALAVRGWNVDVYDAQPACAGGASGLPVGLLVPHHSADDSPRSRLSRSGTRLTLKHAGDLLQTGRDWNPGGVLELHVENAEMSDLADAEAEVKSHIETLQVPTGWSSRMKLADSQGLWHPHAAWIKPARLVQEWLNHERIQFHGGCQVHTLRRVPPEWLLCDVQGAALGRADLVVFANAFGCAEVLARLAADNPDDIAWPPSLKHKLQSLQAMHGTLTMGPRPTGGFGPPFPTFPVNGHGSFVSNLPDDAGVPQWCTGSTFQTDPGLHADLAREHAMNLNKLQALLPDVAQALRHQFQSAQIRGWQGTRCITHDRLPLVGPLDDAARPSLWLCAGMGARGLSFSALCAELLAAWLGGEPLPIENNLAKLLATGRALRGKGLATKGLSSKPL
jgi:tRNA 5-methylaminomethyl-2-thiouridine biosynthesis bifunctional protein